MRFEHFATFTLLTESDQGLFCRKCEYLQGNLLVSTLDRFIGKRSGLRREQKLNFFRLAQRIRDEHGTARQTSPPNCFQSFEDIVELERDIEINDGMGFMIQCMRLDLGIVRHLRRIFWRTSTVEQLVALYDESVPMLERSEQSPAERTKLGFIFQGQFRDLIRTRPCKRPLWRDLKMYLERALDLSSRYMFTSDVYIPDADLDEALSCVLSNARLFIPFGLAELARLLECLVSRGASLYHWDQHGVSSLRRLLGLDYPRVGECLFRKWLTYICCNLKNERGKIIVDNRRLAPLFCLAARRIPSSTIEQLPSKLRPFVRGHREIQGVLAGNIRSPEPVDAWRQ